MSYNQNHIFARQIIQRFPSINQNYILTLAEKCNESEFQHRMLEILINMPDPKTYFEKYKKENEEQIKNAIQEMPALERYIHLLYPALELEPKKFGILINNFASIISTSPHTNKEWFNKLVEVFPYLRVELSAIPLNLTEDDYVKRIISKFVDCKAMILNATRDESKIDTSITLLQSIMPRK